MMYRQPPSVGMIRSVHNSDDAPPRVVEYAYYAVVIYGILAGALGVSVPLLAGGTVAALSAFCVLRLGLRAVSVYKPIAFPLGCAISLVVIQVAAHSESLQETRPLVIWLLTLILVHSLSLRQGFLHRFGRVAFMLGLAVLPYLELRTGGAEVERAGLAVSAAELGNPNGLAAWFGFCSLYFTIVGIETKRNGVRVASWLVAVTCLYVVGLTVSRGTLLGLVIAAVVAFRHLLKRGFIPILCLAILAFIIYETGLFETAAGMYASRGTEETGRLIVWPLALRLFLSVPLTGVGISQVAIRTAPGHEISPHNSFLFLGLASGVVPLVFFLAYWVGAFRSAISANAARRVDASFGLPLLLYAFVQCLLDNGPFMTSWMIVILSVARTTSTPVQRYRMRGWKQPSIGDMRVQPDVRLRYQPRSRSIRA